ncbi:MAG: hypothetical protein ACOYM7_11925, partial [Paludibacter sp.]
PITISAISTNPRIVFLSIKIYITPSTPLSSASWRILSPKEKEIGFLKHLGNFVTILMFNSD